MRTIGDEPEAGGAQQPPAAARRRMLSLIGTCASLLLFGASLFILYRIAGEVSLEALSTAFAEAGRRQILLAAFFTAVSYALLTGYDALALRQLKLKVPYRTTALASFTSYAISFTLGFPLLTGGTVRYWVYAPRGLSAGKVASLTLIAGVSFWLGLALIIGLGLMTQAPALAQINRLAVDLNRLIGALVTGAMLGYLIWVGVKRRAVRIQRWRFELPNLPVSIGQLGLGVGDVSAACAVLFVLLPAGHGIDFATFAAVFAFACLLGIASHAPGGLGVFEATMLLAFSQVPSEQMLSALLLFRIFYYLVPFVLAIMLLGAFETQRRLRAFRESSAAEAQAD
jgi:glycosyltransferase 2 family protein